MQVVRFHYMELVVKYWMYELNGNIETLLFLLVTIITQVFAQLSCVVAHQAVFGS